MEAYHNRLNKRSFKKSVYIKKVEEVYGFKISTQSLQYELIIETHNANIDINNVIYSKKYIPLKDKVDKMINIIDTYVSKYKNKINKCKNLTCIELYDILIGYNNELKEMKELERIRIEKGEKGTKLNLKSIGARVSTYLTMLDMLSFDRLYDSRGMTYERQVNEKIPKKYNCQIFTDEEIMDGLIFYNDLKTFNDEFFNKYYDKTGINLNSDKEQKDFIINLHKNIVFVNNLLVDYYAYKDTLVLDLILPKLNAYTKQDISYVKDISYIRLFEKFSDVCEDINNKNYDNAYKRMKLIIDNDDMNIYERIS